MNRLNKIELFLNYENGLEHIEIDLNSTYKQLEKLKVYNKNLENIIDDENEEIERLNNIINDIHNGLEQIIEQGYDYNEKDKIAIELISKIWK